MTDEVLFQLCKKYGTNALFWRQKFIGLLPEVNRRHLYEKKGFNSIFEFAKKLAGLGEKQVRLVLNLEERFEDKPMLKSLLVNGEVSINKLARVVSIATSENQQVLGEQVKILPQKALETLVRDVRVEQENRKQIRGMWENEHQNAGQKPLFDDESLRAQMLASDLKFDADIVEKLHELQTKGININELMRAMLQKRDEEIAQQ